MGRPARARLLSRSAACSDGDHVQEEFMNCANHPDVAAVAYCRTGGKPMCANCMRSVNGVIYCESCLAARIEGAVPPPPPVPGTVPVRSGPNPALAGILSGFFPFGVGAVYTGQYTKG